ncbi:protein BCCIP homolog [Folsomia candida]|uniref:protein BCCIP homolog n=1 Tax=Folsomia candida TaxID=158441 RepID=UPI000B8F3FC4|nr:protein BCCIP homolog [Folsomia candida]
MVGLLSGIMSDSSDSDSGSMPELVDTIDGSVEEPETFMKGFLAVTPDDADSSGIENLCKQLFKHFEVDVKELAELLVRQNYVTTVLKEEVDEPAADPDDDGTVYGVYSAVNLKNNKDNPFVKQVVNWMLTHAGQSVEGNVLKQLLDFEGNHPNTTGLLIKEKVVNIPGVATCPFMKQLINDLETATENGMQYNFTHFVHVAKMVKIKHEPEYFVDQDDEIIHKNHTRFFDVNYPSSVDSGIIFQNQSGSSIYGKAFRRIYVFTKAQLTDFMNELQNIEGMNNLMAEAASSGLKI